MTSSTASPQHDPLKSITWRVGVPAALFLGLLIVAFLDPLAWMVDRWRAPESYYSHGFLVPLVVLFIVYRERFGLADHPVTHTWVGLGLMLGGLFILLLSGLLSVFFTAAFGLIMVVWGLCGFLFGFRVLRRLLLPAFLLTFMVPLPLAIIEDVSLNMKLLAGRITLMMIETLGIIATNDGATIYLGDATVTVGNACSGLRSLISLVFLGLLFTYFSKLSPPRRVMLFLSSIPIAILANVARVFLLCMVAYFFGSDAISGWIHDLSGYMIFVVAFALLFGVLRLLEWRRPTGDDDPGQTEAHVSSQAGSKGSSHA